MIADNRGGQVMTRDEVMQECVKWAGINETRRSLPAHQQIPFMQYIADGYTHTAAEALAMRVSARGEEGA